MNLQHLERSHYGSTDFSRFNHQISPDDNERDQGSGIESLLWPHQALYRNILQGFTYEQLTIIASTFPLIQQAEDRLLILIKMTAWNLCTNIMHEKL
jgi:hypothetical protein